MSTTIDQSFVRQYEGEVHEAFQRRGGYLMPTVRAKMNVVGKSTTFQKVGKGTATTKARHGVITPMNVDHSAVECTLSDFYAGDWVDRLDEAKINIDERLVLANAGAWALGRKVDEQVITALDSTTTTAITWTLTSAKTVRNALLEMVEAMNAADVPDDGQRYGLLTPRAFSQAMTVPEFQSADYVGPSGLPYTQGVPGFNRWKSWMGVMWSQHTGLPGVGTPSAKVFCYHKTGIGYASGVDVTADITWHGDRASYFVNHMMSGGAVLIDAEGVIEGSINDTTAIATS